MKKKHYRGGADMPPNPWDKVRVNSNGELQGILTDELALNALPYQNERWVNTNGLAVTRFARPSKKVK